MMDASVELPLQRAEDKGRITLFIEMEDLLHFSYVPDENLGYLINPASREPERKIFLAEVQTNVWYYPRDHLREFLDYISEHFEPILYTSAEKLYADYMLDNVIDPDGSVFRHRLYQNSCYLLDKPDEDLYEFVKDVGRFQTRDISRSLLLDTRPLNFLLNPDNGLPVEEYHAEWEEEDSTLQFVINDLEGIRL